MLKSKLVTAAGIAGFIALFTAGTASAAVITTYASRAAFDLAVGPTILEDLNSQAVGTSFNGSSIDVGDFSFVNTGYSSLIQTGAVGSNIDGTHHGATGTFTPIDVIFTFDSAITAFGLDVKAWNDSQIRTTVTAAGTSVPVTAQTGQGTRFFGFSSDTSFTTVTFVGGVGDSWSFDNISYSSQVAEPGTLALFGLSLAGLGYARRKRTA